MAQKIICPNCKKTIDSVSASCPNCGIAITDEIRKKNKVSLLQGFFIIFAIIFGIYLFFSGDDTDMTLPGKPISYYLMGDSFDMKTDANGNPRDVHFFWIRPTKHSEDVTYADLISTVMVAADKYYKEKKNVPIISVSLLMDEKKAKLYDSKLAYVTYIPDKKGIDGVSESPIWNDAVARQRGFSSDEVDFFHIFDEIAFKYNTAEELRAEIANRMGKRLNSNPSENVLLNLKISDQNTIIEK